METIIGIWVVVGAGVIYYLFFSGKEKPAEGGGTDEPEPEAEADEPLPVLGVTGWGGVFIETRPERSVLCVLPTTNADGRSRIAGETAPRIGIDAVIFIPAPDTGGYMWAGAVLDGLAIASDVPLYKTSDDDIERWPEGDGEGDDEASDPPEATILPTKKTFGDLDLRRVGPTALEATWQLESREERALIGVALSMKDMRTPPYPNVILGTMAADPDGAPEVDALLSLRQVNLLRGVPPDTATQFAQFWSTVGIHVAVFEDGGDETAWVEKAARVLHLAREDEVDDEALDEAIGDTDVAVLEKTVIHLCALGELELADDISRRATVAFADHGPLWFQRGIASFMGERTDEAIEHYERAIDADEPEPRALGNLASIAGAAGEMDKALEYMTRAREALPGDALVAKQAVFTLARAGDFAAATALLDDIEDSLTTAVSVPLRVALEQGAEAFEGPIVHTFPLHADMMAGVGSELLSGGQLEAAVNALSRALELQPSHLAAAADLGVALSKLERDDEAIEAYTRTIDTIPGGELLRFNRGNATRRLGQLDEAIADYRRCVEIAPSWVEPRVNLVSTLQMQGDIDAAEKELEALAEQDVGVELIDELREAIASTRASQA